ncbi:hypothetical protein [Desulfovibrio sp. TomC]|uniref:hypothetical protein n=1 Tax=Desulfovibrio sp. TomC TaxID=1562888 RepID=UPI0005BC4CA5|nr:hypothetical protein [Desulfovibrio sp. TomC]
MVFRRINLPLFLMFVGMAFVVGVADCAHAQPPTLVYVYPAAPPPASGATGNFVRTPTGQLYYVDATGAQHRIVSAVTPPGGGLYYYVEGDERPYFIDESQRLYSRDPWGNVYYIEQMRSGGGAVYGGVVQGSASPMMVPLTPTVPVEPCVIQWQKCLDGCSGISPRQAYDHPNCISNCEVIRSQCRDH